MTRYYVTFVCRGSSEGREFQSVDAAVDHAAELVREILEGVNPEDCSLEFSKQKELIR
jgi:hypothetical protein